MSYKVYSSALAGDDQVIVLSTGTRSGSCWYAMQNNSEPTAGVFKLLQPGQRDDESSEHSSIGAIEIRCIALEGRPHVFAGRRKESRVVDETIQKRVDCLQRHPATLLVVMRRNLSPTGCARKVTDP